MKKFPKKVIRKIYIEVRRDFEGVLNKDLREIKLFLGKSDAYASPPLKTLAMIKELEDYYEIAGKNTKTLIKHLVAHELMHFHLYELGLDEKYQEIICEHIGYIYSNLFLKDLIFKLLGNITDMGELVKIISDPVFIMQIALPARLKKPELVIALAVLLLKPALEGKENAR